MALQVQKERNQFARCAQSYRIFLTKFSEKPIFDHESVGAALSYVYDSVYGRKGPVPSESKFRIVNTILLNEQKILDDLETLKRLPRFALGSLSSTTVSFRGVKRLVTEILNDCDDCKEYDVEDLIKIVCKHFKLSSSSENVRKIIRKLKENYILWQKKNNVQASQLPCLIRKRKVSLKEDVQRMLNPIVLLKKDKRLQEMAKKFKTLKKDQEDSKSIKGQSDDERCLDYCNGNLNDKDIDLSQKEGLVFVKQEIDLIDTVQPTSETTQMQKELDDEQCRNEFPSQIQIDPQSLQTVENSSTLAMTNDQAIMLATYNNNFIPPIQLTNNVRFIPHATLMFNSSCNAYMIMPMSQFQPNIVMVNSGGISGYYQGMYNNPMQFNNSFVQNPILAVQQNFPIMPEQQLCFNQGLSPAQEIIQIQSTIESLNSQINLLEHNFASQMHKNQ